MKRKKFINMTEEYRKEILKGQIAKFVDVKVAEEISKNLDINKQYMIIYIDDSIKLKKKMKRNQYDTVKVTLMYNVPPVTVYMKEFNNQNTDYYQIIIYMDGGLGIM